MYLTKKLWEICEKITDGTHQTPKYFDSWVIFLSSKNVTKSVIDWKDVKYIDETQHVVIQKRIAPQKWDILLAKNWTTGIWAIVDKDEIFDIYVSLALLRPKKENIISEFLWYLINSPLVKTQFNSRLRWVWVPNLHLKEIKEVQIPLPPLSTQKLIVEKLDAIFSEIEKSKNLLEKNLKNVDEMNKSVLEKIFANDKWERKKLGEVCEIWPKKNEVIHLDENMFVSFVPMKDLKENEKWFDALEQKSIKEVYKWYTYFAENDVLLAKVTPCFENWKAWIAKNLVNNIWFGSSEFYVLRANKDILPEYIYYVIKQEKFLKHWKNNMSGAVGLQRVTKDFVVNFQIPLPPLETQKNIVSYLDNIFAENQKLKNLYQAQIKNLDEMKQSFLKKAFAGELV